MRTRFAPAPTGALHLGHVANAIFVWGLARASGARVLLRIEDHDRQRSRRTFERALLDDLDWLGFGPDDFPTAAFRAGACDGRQSDRGAIYQEEAAALAGAGLVYGCTCSRQDLAMSAPGPAGERRYPGTCRARGIAPAAGVAWRLRLEPGAETFDDWLLGSQTQEPAADCGDVLIRDRLNNWTYQFVAAVDDFRQAVTLVVRGRDLLASTGRQMQIARRLGRETPPRFAHHALIMKTPDQKLSKSDGDTGIAERRAAGWSAARTIGEAARQVGLDAPVRLSARDAAALVAERWAPGLAARSDR